MSQVCKYRLETRMESAGESTLSSQWPFDTEAQAEAAGAAWLMGLVPGVAEGEVEGQAVNKGLATTFSYEVIKGNNQCQNCDWVGSDGETNDIEDFSLRVSPGEIVPVGECPDCGAVCHYIDPPTYSWGEEHPEFPVEDWQLEVANLDTLLGYSDWVAHQVEAASGDEPGG